MSISGKRATIITHCSVMGTFRTEVRTFSVCDPAPYAQYKVAVQIYYREPRQRRTWIISVTPPPADQRYVTIESPEGVELYDSRRDVPCDMEKWHETAARFPGGAVRIVHQPSRREQQQQEILDGTRDVWDIG